MKKICITGANGFIGKNLCESLKAPNNHIRGFVRAMDLNNNSSETEHISVEDISSKTNLDLCLIPVPKLLTPNPNIIK